MPIYIYEHPDTGETKEIVQTMSEPHVYSEDGIEWSRVYSVNVEVKGSPINPFSERDYLRKTQESKGNWGNMMDLSAELSQKRAEKNGGVDPIKAKYIEKEKKRRHGRFKE